MLASREWQQELASVSRRRVDRPRVALLVMINFKTS